MLIVVDGVLKHVVDEFL